MSDLAVRTPEQLRAAESQAFAVAAIDAIAKVTTPDEAEALLAKVKVAAEAARVMHLGKELAREWRSIEIKAERKWGELLGAAENKGQSTVSRTNSGAERVAQHEARKLAAVPEPVFEQYVEQAETPTKAGLLRAADHESINAAEEPLHHAEPPVLTKRQEVVSNAARDRVEATIHRLDGMCIGLASVDPHCATTTATEEQITEWLAMAEQARSNLRKFTALLRQAT